MILKIVMLRRENRMFMELLVDEFREIFEFLNVGENIYNLRIIFIKLYEIVRKYL